MPNKVTLQVTVDKQGAVSDLRSWGDFTKKTFGDVLAQSTRLNTALGKLALNPDGIISGAELGTQSLRELNGEIASVRENLRGLGRIRITSIGSGLGAKLTEDAERIRVKITGISQAQAEQQRHLDDQLMASKYRNLQISGAQYREYLTQKLSAEETSMQRSIRLNNELADLQIDAMRRVTEAMRSEDAKRTQESREAAQQQARDAREAAAVAGGSRLAQRGTNISAMGGGLRSAGQAMTWGYSAPVLAGVGYSLKAAIGREDATADVAKVYPKESQERIAQLRTDLESLTAELPLTYSQLAKLGNQGGQLGVPIESLKEFVKIAAQLGLTTDMSSEQATEALAKLGGALGMDVSHGTAALRTFQTLGNGLAQMGIEGAASGSEILRTAERFASAGKNAKMSAGDVLALSNGIVSLGQRAEAGGSAALGTITKMTIASANGGKQLAQFANVAGMSTKDFKKLFETDALGAVLAFVGGLDKLEASGGSSLKTLSDMGIKNKNELIALENLSHAHAQVNQLRLDANSAMQKGNALQEFAAKKTSDTASQLKILQNEGEGVAVKLGNELMPTIKALIPDVEAFLRDVTGLIDKFEKLPQPVKDAALELMAVSILAGPLVSGLGNVFGIVGSVTRGFAAFKALRAANDLKDVLTALTNVTGGAKGAEDAVGGLATKTGGLKGLLLSPLGEGTLGALLMKGGLVTLGVALDVYLLKKDFDTAAETKRLTDGAAAQDASMGHDGGFERNTVGTMSKITQTIDSIRDGIKRDKATLAGMHAENKPYAWLTGPVEKSGRYKNLQARIRQEYADERAQRASLHQHQDALDTFHNRPKGGTGDADGVKGQGHSAFGGVKPWVAASGNEIASRFGVRDIGGMATGGHIKDSDHYTGTALDFMVGKNKAQGDALAKYMEANAKAENVKYVIWQQHIWSQERSAEGWRLMPNRGSATANHMDHVHVSYLADPTNASGGFKRRVPFNPALLVNPKDAAAASKKTAAQQDLADRLYEATHSEYQNQRYQAYQTFKDDKGTDPARAKALLLATLKQIDQKESEEQKRHHKETEDQQRAHLARLAARQKEYWDAIAAGRRKIEANKAAASEARSEVSDHMAALADPDAAGFAGERSAAQKRFRERIKAFGGNPSLPNDQLQKMPYSPETLKDFQSAQDELTASVDDIGKRQGQKAADEAQRVKDQAAQDAADVASFQKQAAQEQAELNREVWQHAGGDMRAYFDSLRQEADDALAEVKAKYGPDSKNPNPDAIAAAQKVRDARYAVIGQQEVDDTKAAQEKIDEAQAASVRFEYEQHIISLAQYQDYLRQKLALTAQYDTPEDQKNGILSRNWMQIKGELDQSEGEIKAKPKPAELVGGQPFWDGLAESAAQNGSRVLDAIFHPKDKKNIFKSMWQDFLQTGEEELKGGLKSILKNLITGNGSGKGGLGGLLGGLFGGRKAAGVSPQGGVPSNLYDNVLSHGSQLIPLSSTGSPLGDLSGFGSMLSGGGLPGGLGTDPGMGGGGGGSSPLGLLGMLGKGGLGGLFSHGGLFNASGALGGFGAALPWIGGGLMLNKVLGNPLGKVFGGIKKLFHFSGGGLVPGSGSGDTVPAMLTPGEFVIPKAQVAQAFTPRISMPDLRPGAWQEHDYGGKRSFTLPASDMGPSHLVINDSGDKHFHYEADFDSYAHTVAKKMQTARRAGIPSTR